MYDVLVDNLWGAGYIDYNAGTTILPFERCSSEASPCHDQRLCSRASRTMVTLKLGAVFVWWFHWGLSARENSIAVLYYIFIINFIFICAWIFTRGWFSWVADFGGESCEGKFKYFANLTLLCLSQAQTLGSHYCGPFDHCWPIERFSTLLTPSSITSFFGDMKMSFLMLKPIVAGFALAESWTRKKVI